MNLFKTVSLFAVAAILTTSAFAERPIYLHCATGGRATLAAEQLQRIGYNKVTVISCKAENVCDTFC